MADEIRCYFVVGTGTLPAPGETAWTDVFQRSKTKPFISGIIAAARAAQNHISHTKRSRGSGFLRKFTLCGVEIDQEDRVALLDLLDQQATAYNVTGTTQQKIEGVLQFEFRQSALDLGYTTAQSNQISVTIVGLGASANAVDGANRAEAISEALAYLAANVSIWYS